MLVMLAEFLLFPYTVCIGIDKTWEFTMTVEYTIDACWLLMIATSFCICTEKDGVYEMKFSQIAKGYVKTDFWHDFFSMTTLFLMEWDYSMVYWFRILRFFRLGTMKRHVKSFW